MTKYSHLFTEDYLRGKRVKNRIVMSPMDTNLANPDGSMSENIITYYLERAKGGAGIIITGGVIVDFPVGNPTGVPESIEDRKHIAALATLARGVQSYGALLIPQIHHAGAQAQLSTTGGLSPVCPSADAPIEHLPIRYYHAEDKDTLHTLTTDEIKKIVQKFIQAAINCKDAGCDGVEVHAAHGYLINQFLSRDANFRDDEYGCQSLENRMRFGVEIISGIRQAVGKDFIVGVRIPGKENTSRGLTDDECITIAQTFEKAGADFLDVSYGTSADSSRQCEAYIRPQGTKVEYAARIKKAVSVPVMCVGNLREPQFCENVLAEGKAGYVSLGRQLICDPYWPQKAEEGREKEILKCVSCMEGCINNITLGGRPVRCVLNPTAGVEILKVYDTKPQASKNIVVIGGGPGGMQAAVTASERGHKVTLFEKEDRLGGQLNIAHVPPEKYRLKGITEWYENELTRLGVDVRLGTCATLDEIQKINPDKVIAATGVRPSVPPIEGIESTVSTWSVLDDSVKIPEGSTVGILGGGDVGCETAVYLSKEKNCNVQIFEMASMFATGSGTIAELMAELQEFHVTINLNAKVTKVTKDHIEYVQEGEIKQFNCNHVVASLGVKPFGLELVKEIKTAGYPTIVIGDASGEAKISGAVLSGYNASHSI
ncbi:FAD-dependent oxidoreductase [Vagococcus fluvialis]|uniref:oxidoreductase n=1 Tax=Vagococcus fluvialis TaxID=2738 RepID=UPI003B5B718A